MDQDRFAEEGRRLVATYMNMLYSRGLVTATGGNVSLKVETDEGMLMLITPTSLFKGGLGPDDVALLDMQGQLKNGKFPPSSEWRMHAAIYLSEPSVKAIVHAHPTYALALIRSGARFEPITEEAQIMFESGVGFVPKIRPGTWDLAKSVASSIRGKRAALIEDHGAVTVGKDLTEAFAEMDVLEQNSKVLLLSSLLNGRKERPGSVNARPKNLETLA